MIIHFVSVSTDALHIEKPEMIDALHVQGIVNTNGIEIEIGI